MPARTIVWPVVRLCGSCGDRMIPAGPYLALVHAEECECPTQQQE